jgi:predicted dehydrogenase
MARLPVALKTDAEPGICDRDNLDAMSLVEACYRSAAAHRAVEISEFSTGEFQKPAACRRR